MHLLLKPGPKAYLAVVPVPAEAARPVGSFKGFGLAGLALIESIESQAGVLEVESLLAPKSISRTMTLLAQYQSPKHAMCLKRQVPQLGVASTGYCNPRAHEIYSLRTNPIFRKA